MIFNSLPFVMSFVIFVSIYHKSKDKYKILLILIFSNVMYISFGIRNLIYIYILIVLSFSFHRLIYTKKTKLNLFFGIFLCTIPLLTFKLINSNSITTIPSAWSLAIPLGLSFFTFHAISLIIDTYRDKCDKQYNFLDVAVFIFYFPLLMAGPIERSYTFFPQLHKLKRITAANVALGTIIFSGGLLRKSLANFIGVHSDKAFLNIENLNGLEIVIGVLSFGFQIYLDFSGYSEMARGLSKVLGINITKNFMRPYFAATIKIFWEKWHISLSSWFRDYLYIPLGGSSKSLNRQNLNVIAVMLTSALWHGVGINFLIWGLIHATFIVVENVYRAKLASKNSRITHFTLVPQKLVVFCIVNYAWLFFRCPDMKCVTTAHHNFWYNFGSLSGIALPRELILVALILIYLEIKDIYWKDFATNQFVLGIRMTILTTIEIITSIVLLASATSSSFIYFVF
jgi:alginate O-acetyltransferase complex protein AlgI